MRCFLAIIVALLPLGAVAQSGAGGPAGAATGAATGYTPDDGANWTDPDPTTVAAALDALATAAADAITATLQDLDDLGVVAAANKYIYSTGAGVWAYGDITSAGRALLDDADAAAQVATLGLLPEYRVCSTCAYTTIQSAVTAAGAAGGGTVVVAPGSYTEAVDAASGVTLRCAAGPTAGSAAKRCRINGTAGNPALTIDIGAPGETRESNVFAVDGFLLLPGSGAGVAGVSFECPAGGAQRAELSSIDINSGNEGRALSMTCGAVGSGGLKSLLRFHGDMNQLWTSGSTASVLYHSAGYLDARGKLLIEAATTGDVAVETPAAGDGTTVLWWFEIYGTVNLGAAATGTVTLGEGTITTNGAAPITTNAIGALMLGNVGLNATNPGGACVQGAGVVAHVPSALVNIANCSPLVASTVNGGAGPDAAAMQSRYQSDVAPALYLDEASNLSDLPSVSTARTNLGLGALATGDDSTDVPIAACLDDTDWNSSVCPAATQTALDELADRTKALEGASGGAADAVTKDIAQAAHGLSVGDWVRLSGGDYVEAQANSATNAEVVGVVSAVADVNNFTLQVAGRVTGLSGLTANAVHFLDASTAGAATATEPTGGSVSKPVLIADSTTSGWVLQMRGTIAQASGGWDWAQSVASPAASDWADASAGGADVSMTAISDGTVGDYVILQPGASTTEQYGVTMAAAAGDWVWCARIDRMTDSGGGAVTAATSSMDFVLVAAFVDGTDLDNSTWNGAGLLGAAQDWNGSDIGSISGPGSGTDRWDGALVSGETQDFMGWSTADVCLERSGTTLVAWIGQRAGGMQRADSWTVSADAGLYAIVLRNTDANHSHRVRLPAYGLLSAVPGME